MIRQMNEKMKKLFFYINTIGNGGAERVIVNLASEFAKLDYEVAIITSFKADWEYPVAQNVKRFLLEDKPTESGFLKRNLSRVKKLRKICKEEKPDVLISFMAEPNFRAILATRRLKTKTIISIRNDPNKEYSSKFTKFLARRLFKKADGIVFQTEDAKAWFPKKVQAKSQVIMNAVDEKFFENRFEGEKQNVVACGRLVEQKNYPLLINAFAEISNEIDDNLLIYGEGTLREQLQNLINQKGLEERIKLMGQTNDVKSVLEKAKLFVLSSDYEGMPNALLEAMAMGVPCISTDCPCGGPKFIFNGNQEALILVNDVVALSEKILKALTAEEYLLKLSELSKQNSYRFIPQVIFEEWHKFVKNINDGSVN